MIPLPGRSLLWLVVGTMSALISRPTGALVQEQERPNVLFILADDLGWGDLGCYGNREFRTPNLDRLAAEGTLFTEFSVSGSVCSPSRCAFFTGQYPARHRIHGHYATPELNTNRGMSQWLEPRTLTLAKLLRDRGYRTGHIGKWHLGSGPGAPKVQDYGFDYVGTSEKGGAFDPADPFFRARSTELFVNEALEFVRQSPGKPFYLQLWTLLPHALLNPTDEQLEPFLGKSPQRGARFKSPATIYTASVTDLDRQIGRLLQGLQDQGLSEKTLVVFSSDNGPEDIHIGNATHSGVGSAGPFRGRKRSLYEGGVRVPFVVRWPGRVPAGRVDRESVLAGVDLLPTVARLAGASLPPETRLDGEEMSDVFLGKGKTRSRPLFWEWRFRVFGEPFHRSPILAVREGNWKLLLNPDGSRTELYDLKTDPTQLDNVADRHPEVVTRLSRSVWEWQKELPSGPIEPSAGKRDYPFPQGRDSDE